jgi:hypothetical protein
MCNQEAIGAKVWEIPKPEDNTLPRYDGFRLQGPDPGVSAIIQANKSAWLRQASARELNPVGCLLHAPVKQKI